MKKILIILSFIFPVMALADFKIQDRINSKNFYRDQHQLIFNNMNYSSQDRFKKVFQSLESKTKTEINYFINATKEYLPSKILLPLIYWRFIRPNSLNVEKVLTYLFYDKVLILRDYAEDPRSPNKARNNKILRKITRLKELKTDELFSKSYPLLKEKSSLLANLRDHKAFTQGLIETDVFSLNLEKSLNSKRLYSLSPYGYVPGNKVSLISHRNISKKQIKWFKDHSSLNGNSLNFNNLYDKIPFEDHYLFQHNPILKKSIELIAKSQESIFINISLIGGNLGATFIKFLLDQTKKKRLENKNFKVFMIQNRLDHGKIFGESSTLSAYLERRLKSEKDLSDSVFLLKMNDQENKQKVDNTKLIVIDANSKSPEALVGSANISDQQGGFFLNSMVHIEGPAAAIIQSSYIYDVKRILKGSSLTLSAQDKQLLRRNEIIQFFNIKRSIYPYKGSDQVRIIESGIDSKINNSKNIMIDAIRGARKNIFMEQKYLYDSDIIYSLIKKKISMPSVHIKIIIDNNESDNNGGFPNSIFIKRLLSHGILVRTRGLPTFLSKPKNGKTKKRLARIFQENNQNITSIDGTSLLVGSSSISPLSMKGYSRELGVEIFSNQAKIFESRFLEDWNNNKKTLIMDIENFQLIISGKKLERKISSIINNITATILESKNYKKE